jgi:hypothetical protein
VMLTIGLFVVGMALLSVGIVVFAQGRANSATAPAPTGAAKQAASVLATEPASSTPTPSWASTAAPPLPEATPPPPVVAAVEPPAPAVDKLVAYRGLGSWVDIYDDGAFKDPAAAVADMASHGVRTLYLETGNSRSAGELFNKPQLQQFITEAHAHDMKIVAWYLPDLKDLEKDYTRIDAAIRLTTPGGQKFDSFALDIESGAVTPQSARNSALLKLSKRIRDSVGPSYPLGAIIPSPVGLSKTGSYWPDLPYSDLAGIFEVFVPMGYYTYHGNGAALALSDTLANARILRAQKGCSAVPIHMIGGVAEESSAAEVEAFVRGSKEAGCIGASLYSWAGTTAAHWAKLEAFGSGAP